jgi:uncharacterized 2Fe-2S/4Fe-4S cluster protein (DUF4445 family)
LQFAVSEKAGLRRLQAAFIGSMEMLLLNLLADSRVSDADVSNILCVGNSAMHHLALSISPHKLARAPFVPSYVHRAYRAKAKDVGLGICADAQFEFLPNLGGFVGSDALAVIIACGIQTSRVPVAAIDIGTNGEVILGDRRKIFVASTSAGPAFEGWHISCGMPAVEGAIESVKARGGTLTYKVLGGKMRPLGLCGSGLIDAVKILLDMKVLDRSGRLKNGRFKIYDNIILTQRDVREIQLVKAAIQAAMKILRKRFGGAHMRKVFLTGRFGSRISKANAKAIGILPEDIDARKVEILEHGALKGARLILCSQKIKHRIARLYRKIVHVELHREKGFQDEFVAAMRF